MPKRKRYPHVTIALINGRMFVNTWIDNKNFDCRPGATDPEEVLESVFEGLRDLVKKKGIAEPRLN